MIFYFIVILLSISLTFTENIKPEKPIVTDKVYLDMKISGKPVGRIVIGLFGSIVPKTVRNFKKLAERPQGKGYKGSKIHRVIKGFVVQGGDYDGTGGDPIYKKPFEDENFILKHYGPGWVNMANYGKDTNRAQFSVLMKKATWLDDHHVVFGKILSGMNILRQIEDVDTNSNDFPTDDVVIADCGSIPVYEPFAVSTNGVSDSS